MPFSRADAEMEMNRTHAFTLIELLVVIVIIAVLAGLAFPVYQSVQNTAKRTQAKNDVTQIVTAVNAFYTEYGKYPVTGATTADTFFGGSTDAAPTGATLAGQNDVLIDVLRNNTASSSNGTAVTSLNPRGIVFLEPHAISNSSAPKSGVVANGASGAGRVGVFYDPWGSEYRILIDTNYDNTLRNPYADNPGGTNITAGVAAWSFGKNGALGGGTAGSGFATEPGSANNYTSSGDVASWQ
jgi:prepilin-type N-terminal cleavage/methylation domain-containing protein